MSGPTAIARVFIDTNILVYLLAREPGKSGIADSLLRDPARTRSISSQVLSEFANAARKKTSFSWLEIRYCIATFQETCNIQPVTEADIETALTITATYRYSWFDSLIIAAALRSGATTLFTEDMQHGQVIGGLTLINPFLDRGSAAALPN